MAAVVVANVYQVCVQFLGVEVFQPLVQLGPGFVHHLGRVLTLARTTFLEIPSPSQLATGIALLRGQSEADLGIFRVLLVTIVWVLG